MMLTDYQQVKTVIGIPPTDLTQDSKIQLLTQAADACAKQYCKQAFENAVYVEYPFRLYGEAIVLAQRPVLSYILAGSTVSGQPTITRLPSTSNLLVGMPALLAVSPQSNNLSAQPFPNGAAIQSIDSTSQVTLTANATQTLSAVNFQFGLAMWYDPNGAFGDGIGSDPSGPFAASSLLRAGLDYALQRDQPDGTSKSGKLIRLSSVFGYLGVIGAWGPYGSGWDQRGTLSSYLPPIWAKWPPGSVKVLYAAGLGVGAIAPNGLMPNPTTIPSDLTTATTMLAVWMWRNSDTGGMLVTNESFQGYSGAIAPAIDALKTDAELGSVRQILSRYRLPAI